MPKSEHLTVEQVGLAPDALAGQVAVVTGAGQGIGREIAIVFARLGARVVIAEISPTGQETEHIVREAGGQALFVKTDVASEADVAGLAHRTRGAFGPADVLINNAILSPVAPVLEMDVALWDRVMAVNLRGTFLTCKAFLPGMLARQRGTIVNMVSTDAMPFISAYIASKQGIAGFSQSLAAEVGPEGVRVIAFVPGMVDTPGLRGAAQDLAPRLGMSRDEFLGMAMPAGRAALATACLVATLADEYHGEQVDGYTVLERAGFAAAPGAEAKVTAPAVESTPSLGPVSASLGPVSDRALRHDRAAAFQQAVMLSQQLQEVIAETAAEFNQLPVFVRPLAQRGFRSKSGQRTQDWTQTAAELARQLEKMQAADATAGAAFRAAQPRLKALLDGLLRYYHEAPAETARFTRDAEFIAHTTQVLGRREAVVRSLIAALDTLQTLSNSNGSGF